MSKQITFTARERDLIVELLEREQHDLPHEIHHTDSREFRASLERRLELVGTILSKVEVDAKRRAAFDTLSTRTGNAERQS